jgi:predicted N-formylglutamate amidohydrolase
VELLQVKAVKSLTEKVLTAISRPQGGTNDEVSTMTMRTLLKEDDPEPYRVIEGAPSSDYIVICDHAGNRIPRLLGNLGVAQRDLDRHIGWDIGASDVAESLGRELAALVVLQPYSRLVIDCNRPLTSPQSVVQESDGTVIPGNLAITPEQAELRAQCIFEPYHTRIRRELDERSARGRTSLLIFLHTFTPVLAGSARAWHAGVLHHRDKRLAAPLLRGLRSEQDLVIGDNEPYAASESTDYGLVEHGERRGLPCVELELRQDLLKSAHGRAAWVHRLAGLLRSVPLLSN